MTTFTIQDPSTLDPAALSDELIKALGSNFGISTAGTVIQTNSPQEPDPVAFQAVLDAHVAASFQRQLQKLIQPLSDACQAAITAGFPTVINGQPYTVTLTQIDQNNALMAASTVEAVMARATGWSAAKTVNLFDFLDVNGEFYICEQAGTTGSNMPTMPTAFQTTVTDGTVQWALFGLLVGTTAGNVWCDAPTIYQLFAQGVNYVNTCRSKYQTLKAEILASQDLPSATLIKWS